MEYLEVTLPETKAFRSRLNRDRCSRKTSASSRSTTIFRISFTMIHTNGYCTHTASPRLPQEKNNFEILFMLAQLITRPCILNIPSLLLLPLYRYHHMSLCTMAFWLSLPRCRILSGFTGNGLRSQWTYLSAVSVFPVPGPL